MSETREKIAKELALHRNRYGPGPEGVRDYDQNVTDRILALLESDVEGEPVDIDSGTADTLDRVAGILRDYGDPAGYADDVAKIASEVRKYASAPYRLAPPVSTGSEMEFEGVVVTLQPAHIKAIASVMEDPFMSSADDQRYAEIAVGLMEDAARLRTPEEKDLAETPASE